RRADAADRINAEAYEFFYHARALARGDHPEYNRAIAEYLKAEDLWRRVNNRRRQANAAERVSQILREHGHGDWEGNLVVTKRAFELYRAISDHKSAAKMLVWIAIAYRHLGELDLAENYYRRALQMASDRGDDEVKAEVLMNLGVLLNQIGRKFDAIDAYEQSVKLWRRQRRNDNQ